LKDEVDGPRLDYRFQKLDVSLEQALCRCKARLPWGTRFVKEEEFIRQTLKLEQQIEANPLVKNLAKGFCLPIPLPQLPQFEDYGAMVESFFEPAMERSGPYQKGSHSDRIGVTPGSRHHDLIKLMEKKPSVGLLYFPLQGFSPSADVAMIKQFPQGFYLCGVADLATAAICYGEALLSDPTAPRVDCTGNTYKTGNLIFTLGFQPTPNGCKLDTRYENPCSIYTGAVLYTGLQSP
jgi:hypothetical protein